MSTTRLPPHPAHVIDHEQTLTFTFAGERIQARTGDTIASALYAAGQRTFSRSFKYHRPRGLLCGAGQCPNCLMNVDGTPSVRACTEPVRQGMRVQPQNAWPSLKHDLLSIIDTFDWLLPIGFYYKTFIRPRFFWPLAEKFLRRAAGLGEINTRAKPKGGYDHEYRYTDITVIGGGPAGLTAAYEAANLGCQVTLVDDQPELGGHLRFQTGTYENIGEQSGLTGFALAGSLRERVTSQPNVDILSSATVFGGYEGGLLGVMQAKRLIHLRTQRVIIATGSHEYPAVFANNDLPGVMLGSGVRRLLHLYGVQPGTRAVVVCHDETGWSLATELLSAGIRVAAVVESRYRPPEAQDSAQQLQRSGVEMLTSYAIQAARGTNHVEGALVVPLDAQHRPFPHAGRFIPCDLICLSTDRAPATALVAQSGGELRYDEALGQTVPQQLPPQVFCAGDVTGIHHLPATLVQGRLAGLQAVHSLRASETSAPASHIQALQHELDALEQEYRHHYEPYPQLSHVWANKKQFVCVCEDITHKDLAQGVAEGFDEVETLKRYSTFSMGPCQGRMCATSSARLCARYAGSELATRTTTARPPVTPVPLGVLAGRGHQPEKHTPLHHRHIALGAEMMLLGSWKRPYAYTTPSEEHGAVRERVGLIDVSTLGKLEVKGKDAARLLDKVYTHTFSTLRVGRIRYGVMCDDSGIIIDDGTVSRLADDHFFLTTTTGNVEFVEQWLKWWTAGTDLCAHVTNVTGGLAAMNIAGPNARQVLGQLTDTDLSAEAFPYMACRRATVAGVPALLLRIGFVGETGWEIHVPAECGEQVWDAIMTAGAEFQIVPFGVGAQRILRLEKKHVIVGQDTDALSNPLEADMEWVVKFNKDDFIGKRGLQAIQERGPRHKLVGFALHDSGMAEGGQAVVVNGQPAGRVASAAFSPTAGKCVGLAWVPVEVASGTSPLQIRINGTVAQADIIDDAFYDPQGERLRS